MSTKTLSIEELIEFADQLSAREKARLAEHIVASLARELNETPLAPRRSLLGILSDLGPAPSEEDIAEVRREMWANVGERDDY